MNHYDRNALLVLLLNPKFAKRTRGSDVANFGFGALQRVPTGVNRDSQMASAERV
jgi:hypothetical protein